MKTPLRLLIKKCCLLSICRKSKTFRNNEFVYLFIPYKDEKDDRYVAYVEAPKAVLINLFSEQENYILDLLDFSKLLHIEPQQNINEERLIEIEDFYCKCRDSKNYVDNVFYVDFRNQQQHLAC